MEQILHTNYLENAGINEFEHIRACLRDLMKYLPRSGRSTTRTLRITSSPRNGVSQSWRTMT